MGRPLFVFCQCAYRDFVPPAVRRTVAAALRAAGADAWIVPDLCREAADGAAGLARLRTAERLVVFACYPRAVRWLLHGADVRLPPERLTVLNLRVLSAGDALRAAGIVEAAPPDGSEEEPPSAPEPGSWVPWFPVLDRDRCTNCRQCFSFCPFGVYAVPAGGTVEVRNPRQCKDNCPACARVCPELAIVFPKCPDAPINGADVTDADAVRRRDFIEKAMQPGGDLRTLLARRRAQAAARLQQRAAETASAADPPRDATPATS